MAMNDEACRRLYEEYEADQRANLRISPAWPQPILLATIRESILPMVHSKLSVLPIMRLRILCPGVCWIEVGWV
jgi:hypothetical protein